MIKFTLFLLIILLNINLFSNEINFNDYTFEESSNITYDLEGIIFSADNDKPLSGVNIILLGANIGTRTDINGKFELKNIPAGFTRIRVRMVGYKEEVINIDVQKSKNLIIKLEQKSIDIPNVEIIGNRPDALTRIPGSVDIINSQTINRLNPIGTNEVIRKAGIYVRDEDGFGLRPNIGIRGLFPTRSNKVLLLEDGVPLTQAPYGDPATYYHPPITRFEKIEILRGNGQILFGPQTVGGVINYITSPTPSSTQVNTKLIGGTRDYFDGQLNFGSTFKNLSFNLDYTHKSGQLARENTSTNLNDIVGKISYQFEDNSKLILKGSYYKEISNLTYAGITKIEFEENPYQNQFKDDWLYFDRIGTHLLYERYLFGNSTGMSINLYAYEFNRDWWRQGNNGGTNSTNPGNADGVRTILNPDRNDGRNRNYKVWGIEPRFRFNHNLLNILNETDFGLRAHYEIQNRKQIQGDSPTARDGKLVEDNYRTTDAYAVYIQNRFFLNELWNVSAGLRVENISYMRNNKLLNVKGDYSLTELIPGIGVTFNPNIDLTIFAGAHRGFSPPRVEDVISNNNGSVIELDPERSWNIELGARYQVIENLKVNATVFHIDFDNQIIPASLAGGSTTTLTNAGKTLHQGVELKIESILPLDNFNNNIILNFAYTYLPVAKFNSERFSTVDNKVNINGNRLLYAPEHTYNFTIGYEFNEEFYINIENVLVSSQYSDDLNTIEVSNNGRAGKLEPYSIWNASANYKIKQIDLSLIFSVKNVFDNVYIVDMSRGIIPGSPRLINFGLEWRYR